MVEATTVVQFIAFGDLQLDLLKNSLRIEAANTYQHVAMNKFFINVVQSNRLTAVLLVAVGVNIATNKFEHCSFIYKID